MKIKYEGWGEFDPRNLDSTCPLHMMELQQQSKALVDGGWSFSVLKHADREARAYARARARFAAELDAWREAGADPDAEPVEPDEPESMFVAMATINFLTIRAGGHRISLEQAAAIPFKAMQYLAEPSDSAAPDEDDEPGEGDVSDPSGPASPAGPATPDDGASHAA